MRTRAERRKRNKTMTGISLDHKALGAAVPRRETGWDSTPRPRGGPAAPRRPATRRLASIGFAAEKEYLALARMTAMHVAGLLGLPISRVTDLRLAVDEACALFLSAVGEGTADATAGEGATARAGDGATVAQHPQGVPGPDDAVDEAAYDAEGAHGQLALRFDREGEVLRIRVSGPAPSRCPDEDDMGWTLLCALVGEPRWETREGIGTLTLTEPIPTRRR